VTMGDAGTARPQVRSLVVMQKVPLPADSGGKQRALHLARGLLTLGAVDLFLLTPEIDHDARSGLQAMGFGVLTSSPGTERRRWDTWSRWCRSRDLPLDLTRRDFGAARDRFQHVQRDPYDLVLFMGVEVWQPLAGVVSGCPIIDMEVRNLLASRLADVAPRSSQPRARARALVSRVLRSSRELRLRADARRWERLQRAAGRASDLVTVCSAADRSLLGLEGAAQVVPNGFEIPPIPRGRAEVSDPPTILFPGKMTYQPNADGAVFLVEQVLPTLRELVPGIQVEIVGQAPAAVRRLGAESDVEVSGYIANMEDALARADLVVVPLRSGVGTRIKILEAWAHRIPVVSTTVGAEGLDHEDGVHLLIADSPAAIAEACRRTLTDPDLRVRLVREADELVRSTYRWSAAEERMAEVAASVLGSPGSAATIPERDVDRS